MNEINQKLVDEACVLFTQMVAEGDRDKRMDLKIEINAICLKGKFDYHQHVYSPMAASLKAAKC
jgi:hypothetical protein